MKESAKESVVVNYYSQMRVQKVFPLSVDLHSIPGSLTGRVQVRPVIPGALVTPGIREVDLGPDGSSLNFSVAAMACGQLKHAQLAIFQDGHHKGNVALEMKGVRQLDSWIFVLFAAVLPALIYFFTTHLDWSRSANVPRAMVLPARMPHASDTPVSSNATNQRPPGRGMQPPGGAGPPANRGAAPGGPPAQPNDGAELEKPGASKTQEPPPQLTGAVERSIAAEVPEFHGISRSVAVQMQDCYEILHNIEKSNRISLYIGLGFLALALISAFMNRTKRTQRRSNLSEAAG